MRLKRLFDILFEHRHAEISGPEKNVIIYGSMFFTVISAILTILNIQKRYWFMAGTTGVLIIGFLLAAIWGLRNRLLASRIIMAIMCGIIFSVYAAAGENEGFAILWILLVPIIGMSLLGLRIGFLLGAYFQLFLVVLFYTPLVYQVQQFYTSTFVIRFPVIYFASFGACTIMMCEKQDLYDKVHHQAYYDGLTNLYNRAYYNEYAVKADKFPKLTVVAMDLNGLKYANDTLGHEAGDKLLCEAADMILAVFPKDACFRTGGDEFVVISNDDGIGEKVEAFRTACPNVSAGYAARAEFPDLSFTELSKEADRRMYIEKEEYHRIHGRRNDPRL